MRDLKAVFWDVDGTLADTEMYGHRVAFNNAFNKFNLSFNWSISEYVSLLDIQGGKERIRLYSESNNITLSDSQISDIHQYKQKQYSNLLSLGNIPFRKGVIRLVHELKANQIEQWIE